MKRLTLAMLAASSLALEKVTLKEDGHTRTHPIVEQLPCTICAVDSEYSQICLGYEVNSILGWKWEQTFYDDTSTPEEIDGYYHVYLKLYVQTKATLEPLLKLWEWMSLAAKGHVQPFKVGGFLQGSYYTGSRRTCINMGYIFEDLTIDVDMNLRLAQCYKDIIECYYNFENWTGPNAKWLEECTLSAPTQTNLWHWDYVQESGTSTYITEIGDGTDT